MQVRTATIEELPQVLGLYRRVAANPGGLARLVDEIDDSHVHSFLSKAVANGLTLVAIDDRGEIIGEIHAYSPNLYCFSHVLSDLTIAVDPEHQGKGVGRLLFTRFLTTVTKEYPYITRVELIARESNEAAMCLYESLGFRVEGKMKSRIRNVDGTLEADIPMAWIRV
jgi:ribosomal protein S18 acetylase RimI-like enzyme